MQVAEQPGTRERPSPVHGARGQSESRGGLLDAQPGIEPQPGNGRPDNGHTNGSGSIVQVPYYDSKHGTLWWGDRLVKQLAHDAFNQRAFLEAAQRQGWPQPIETPLPVPERIDYRNVLHTTLQRLNDRVPGIPWTQRDR